MGVFEALFRKVEYLEVSKLYEELEGVFSSITEGIELDIERPQEEYENNVEATEEEIIKQIEKQAYKWDETIDRNRQAGEAYINIAKKIGGIVGTAALATKEEFEQHSVEKPLMDWIYGMERPHSFAQLLYYHQGMRQLRCLLEMYHNNADRLHNTSRHLFEKGMALLKAKEDSYFDEVYSKSHGLYNETSWLLNKELYLPINWVADKSEVQSIREALYYHLKYAHRAYRKQKIKGTVVETLKPYTIHFNKYEGKNISGRFKLDGNLNGYVGYREVDKTIFIGFSGTEPRSACNWKTNFCQYFGKLDPVYLQAAGLLHSVWMGKSHRDGFSNSKIVVCGHSLGGGLMQFSIGACVRDNIVGYGYNSTGLSNDNLHRLWYRDNQDNIFHLHLPIDVVFTLPGTRQLGRAVKCESKIYGPIRAHFIGSMRKQTGKYKNDYVKLDV